MRERVAHATFEVIAARGFSGLRTAAVAEQAGVSQGALLHHFETKNGLTLATVEFAFARASAKTEAIIAQGLAKGIDPIDMMLSDFRLFFFNDDFWVRSEEHTSELQSIMRISYAVFSLNTNKRNAIN